MKQANLRLEPLACPSCLQKIEGAIVALDGVDRDSVDIKFNSGRVSANFDDNKIALENIVEAVEKIGYPVQRARAKAI